MGLVEIGRSNQSKNSIEFFFDLVKGWCVGKQGLHSGAAIEIKVMASSKALEIFTQDTPISATCLASQRDACWRANAHLSLATLPKSNHSVSRIKQGVQDS